MLEFIQVSDTRFRRGTMMQKLTNLCCEFSGDEFDEKTQGVIVEDVSLIYPSDVEADKKGLLWVLFNRLSKFQHSVQNAEEINIRILSGPIRSLIKGTVCDAM